MKTKILPLFSLLALLLVSTSILAEGRPTGIRIGRAVSGGGLTVEIDATITGTYSYYGFDGSTNAWLGNVIRTFNGDPGWQYASSNTNVPSPRAVDWGDSYYLPNQILFGPPGGPYRGTFSHTYDVGGTYTVTIGDALCCGSDGEFFPPINSGNLITGDTRYVETTKDWVTFSDYTSPILLAITANATVTTGAGIPALNVYGLLAMSLILVGTGVLVFRRPGRNVV